MHTLRGQGLPAVEYLKSAELQDILIQFICDDLNDGWTREACLRGILAYRSLYCPRLGRQVALSKRQRARWCDLAKMLLE